jgi:ribosome-binding factor A
MKNQNSTNLSKNYNNLSVSSNLKKDNLNLVNAYYYLKNIMDKRVYVNDEALPFVFSVNKLKLVQDLNEVKYYFYFLKFNPSNEALISQDFIYSKDFQKNYKNKKYSEYFKLLNVKSDDFIEYILTNDFGKSDNLENKENKGFFVKKIGNGNIELNIKSNQNLFIIINNLYFPGFKAYLIKNKNYKVEIPIIKVNGLVKGVLLPKGEYQFYLVYQPFNGYLIIFNLIYILFILPLILVLSYNSKLLKKFKS